MDVVKDHALSIANRALWRLPFPPGSGSIETIVALSVSIVVVPLLVIEASKQKHPGVVYGIMNAVPVATGWLSVATGVGGGSGVGIWHPNTDLYNRQEFVPDEIEGAFFVARVFLGGAALVATGMSLRRLPTIAEHVFSSRAASFEWSALLLSVADITYWQLHSGRTQDDGRFTWQ